MPNLPAARVGDPIAHSHAGLGMALGVGLGLLAGAVLVGATIATGGAALAVVAAVGGAAAMTSASGFGGQYIGEASMRPACGTFVTGSHNVFINGRPATFTASSAASCDSDSGLQALATGSATVIINTGLAGRRDEKTACGAKSVTQVSPDVFIGGPSAQDPRVTLSPEVPAWATTALQVIGVAGALAALPYAVVAVGVPGILISAGLGTVGHELGGEGGRALGQALGLSEAGMRTLEVLGGAAGGALGGAAGARASAGRFGTPPHVQKALGKMPLKFQAEYAAAKASGWKKPDFGSSGARKLGLQTWYPPNNGGVGTPKVTRLPNNQKLDRFGHEGGSFMSNAGDSFEQRALPGQPSGPPNKYTTQAGRDGQGLKVEESEIAPWFDQPGGGTQYRLVDPSGTTAKYSVELAKKHGYLTGGH